MSTVDWSKAPEGFPIWVEDLKRDQTLDQSGWHADYGDRYEDQSGDYWLKSDYYAFRVHERPDTPQWNGEGLPPVGASVEYKGFKDQWKQGSYVGQFRGQIVIGCHESGVVGICASSEIRPIPPLSSWQPRSARRLWTRW